jgi:hypothetical protein
MIGAGAVVTLVVAGGTAASLALTSGGSSTASPPATTSTSAAAPTTMAPTMTAPPAANQPAVVTPTTSLVTTNAGSSATAQEGAQLISDTCLYSREANDDPILMPGQTGQSMAHDFFGNATTSATSTAGVRMVSRAIDLGKSAVSRPMGAICRRTGGDPSGGDWPRCAERV